MIILVFVVLLGSTFIFGGIREGAKSGKGSGGGGVDKECAKLGFTAPKIDKKDINGSLEKTFKNIKKVAEKHWPFSDIIGNKPKNDKAEAIRNAVVESKFMNNQQGKLGKEPDNQKIMMNFLGGCVGLYDAYVGEHADEEKQTKIIKELTPEFLKNAIKGGGIYLDLLNNNHKTLEGDDEKKMSNYIICLCKQWIQILKQYQKAKGNGGGDDDGGDGGGDGGDGGGEDDDEGKNKKKKKSSSKKKKKDEDDGGDDE